MAMLATYILARYLESVSNMISMPSLGSTPEATGGLSQGPCGDPPPPMPNRISYLPFPDVHRKPDFKDTWLRQ